MIFLIMVVVVHTSALNDTSDLAGRLDTGQAQKLGAWWKNWSDSSGLHWSRKPREVRFTGNKSKCVLSSEFLN